jgi:hypothetical protein
MVAIIRKKLRKRKLTIGTKEAGSCGESQNVLHGVQTCGLSNRPFGGSKSSRGENNPIGRPVGEFQTLADSCEHDEVIAHNIAPAEGMGADLSSGTLACDPLATVGDIGIYQIS